jgi:hypothetical protein
MICLLLSFILEAIGRGVVNRLKWEYRQPDITASWPVSLRIRKL